LALKGSRWESAVGGPRDIHVLRGQTSRPLDTFLVLELDPGPYKRASDRPFPPDVTGVTFDPIFNFTRQPTVTRSTRRRARSRSQRPSRSAR
jgi:hypothetical protein